MKIVSVLLGIALVMVSGLAIHFSRQVEAERRHAAELRLQIDERDARIESFARTAAAPVGMAGPVPAPDTPIREAPGASASSAETAAIQDMLATMQAQNSSPEQVARRRVTGRVLMEGSNPDIDEALGLTPGEVDKLFDLLVTHQERSMALFQNPAERDRMSPEERSAAILAQQQSNEAELRTMLGSKYAQWQDYEETRSVWQQRRDLHAVLEAGGIPMTDAQSKALIAALSAEQRVLARQTREALANGPPPASEVRTRYTTANRQRLLTAAAPHLSPQQLEGYRGLLERAAAQESSMVSTLRAAEARAKAAAPASEASR